MGDQSSNRPIKQPSNQPDRRQSEPYSYRRLDVWNRAQEMAAGVVRLARNLPRDPASVTLVRQMVDAAGSVGANIAEGHGRFTFATYRNHLSIARGSACETGSWLDLLRRTDYVKDGDNDPLQEELQSIVAILTVKMRDLDQRTRAAKRTAVREEPAPYYSRPPDGDDELWDLEID